MKKIIYTLFLFSFTNLSFAQWVQCNGPWQGNVNSFTNTATAVFAGTAGDGIYTSTDDGIKWKPAVLVGLSNSNVRCFLWSGTNLFAGTDGGVFLSTNNGSSWFAVNSGLYNTTVKTLVELGSSIYAGTSSGVFITTNNGASWYNSSYGITDPNINSLIVSGNNIFAGTNGGVFKSTDNGGSWASANFGLISQNVNSLILNGSIIFAGTSYLSGAESVYKSTDEGNSWTSSGLLNQTVFSLSFLSSDLYAGTSSGIYRSSDNGVSWSPELGMAGNQINSIYASGSNIIIGTLEGISISTNGGTVWNAVGYRSTYVWSIDGTGPNLWATAFHYEVYLSTNNGDSWVKRTNDLHPEYRYIDIVSTDSSTYVAYINNNLTNTGVYKTTNNGLNWNWMTGFVNRSINCIEAPSDSMLFIGLYFKNGDFGFHGYGPSLYTMGLPNLGVWEIAVKEGNVFAATYDGVYKSTNYGVDWTNTGISGNKLVVHGNNIYAAATDNSRGIYRSSDNGATWNLLGLTDKDIMSLAVFDNGIIAGIMNEGYFVSIDNGANWYPKNEGLDSIPTNLGDIVIRDGIIYSAIDGLSIWKRSVNNITEAEEISEELPRTFLLMQNYPNPFNPSTVISYQLPVAGLVTLKIYDLLGREVATLINEEKAAGSYNVEFNPESRIQHPVSGVYFYRLQAGGYIETKKMLLLK